MSLKRPLSPSHESDPEGKKVKQEVPNLTKEEILTKIEALFVNKKDILSEIVTFKKENSQDITFYTVGKHFYTKYGTYTQIAYQIFELGTKFDDPDCLNWLGKFYMDGIIVKKNIDTALELFEKSKSLGSIKSYKNLAKAHYSLHHTEIAKKMLEIGVDLKDPSAICYMGEMYENGEYGESDFDKAKEMYEMSYSLGSKHAIYNMGRVYHHQIGANRDYDKARTFYEQGVKKNSKECLNNLGVVYYEGLGVTKDYSKAFEFYSVAAQRGDAKANYNLALLYKHGRGVEKNHKKEKELYEIAIEKGNVMAMNNLGLIYKLGNGVPQDYNLAFYWFELGASHKNYNSMHNLAGMWDDGQGCTMDKEKAISLYEECIRDGEIVASMCNLGDIYFFDLGPSKDNFEKAHYYYEMALNCGSTDYGVKCNLGLILTQGSSGQKNEELGIKYLQEAAENGSYTPVGDYLVGLHFFQAKEYDKAVQFFWRACESDHNESNMALKYMMDNDFGKTTLEEMQRCRPLDLFKEISDIDGDEEDF